VLVLYIVFIRWQPYYLLCLSLMEECILCICINQRECKTAAAVTCSHLGGLAIAQTISHRLPTVALCVRSQVMSCGICGGQSGTRAGFLQVLLFPLPVILPLTVPHSSIIWGWYYRPNSGWCSKWTRSHPARNKLNSHLDVAARAGRAPSKEGLNLRCTLS
jgi:hypothetical protein